MPVWGRLGREKRATINVEKWLEENSTRWFCLLLVLLRLRHIPATMSLRAKRAALAAKVTGAPGEDAGTPPASTGTASPRVASPASAGSPLPTAASSASVVPSSNEKLDQIAASFAPAIIGGHQAKQPPAYILEDSVRLPYGQQIIESIAFHCFSWGLVVIVVVKRCFPAFRICPALSCVSLYCTLDNPHQCEAICPPVSFIVRFLHVLLVQRLIEG